MDVDAPRTVAASGGRLALVDNCETPDTLEVAYEYEKNGQNFLLVWSHTDANTHGLEGLGLGIMFQGTEATLVANYDTHKLLPEKGRALHEPPKTLPRSVGHHREWLNAIKSRAQCSCNFAYGHRPSSAAIWATLLFERARSSNGTPRPSGSPTTPRRTLSSPRNTASRGHCQRSEDCVRRGTRFQSCL